MCCLFIDVEGFAKDKIFVSIIRCVMLCKGNLRSWGGFAKGIKNWKWIYGVGEDLQSESRIG